MSITQYDTILDFSIHHRRSYSWQIGTYFYPIAFYISSNLLLVHYSKIAVVIHSIHWVYVPDIPSRPNGFGTTTTETETETDWFDLNASHLEKKPFSTAMQCNTIIRSMNGTGTGIVIGKELILNTNWWSDRMIDLLSLGSTEINRLMDSSRYNFPFLSNVMTFTIIF